MSRTNGLSSFSANFEPQVASPLDARHIVETKADLTTTSVWEANDGTVYTYVGMIVCVYNDGTPANNGVYYLTAADYTVAGNWEQLGSGGSGDTTSIINSYTAGESISAYNILVQESDGKVDVADSSDTNHIQKVVGLATTSAVLDDSIDVQSTGKMTNAGWSWTPGAKLYFTSSGTLTETVPSTGFIQQVAVAETATTITINLGLCIALS
jgi:hypothetical protein